MTEAAPHIDESSRLENSPFMASFNANRQQMIDLYTFMARYAIAPEDAKTKPNFICTNPEMPGKYKVPIDMIGDLMGLLNICYKAKIPYQFSECQYANTQEVSSLFFDFVFETKEPVDGFDKTLIGMSRNVFTILMKYLTLEKERTTHHMMFLRTTNPVYPTAANKYRSKFRVIYPSVMVNTMVKLFVYQRVYHSKEMRRIFQERMNYDVRECLQMKLRNAPVSMVGGFVLGEENEPMVLHSGLTISVSRENGFWYDDSGYSEPSTTIANPVHELSVNYNNVAPTAIIHKRHYELNGAGKKKLVEDLSKLRMFFMMAYDDSVRDYTMLAIDYPEITTIHQELDIIKQERFDTWDKWMIIIKSLASSTVHLKSLAVIFTFERAGKIKVDNDGSLRLMTWDDFTDAWNSARAEHTANYGCPKYSWRSLRYWANEDDCTQMRQFTRNRLMHMITHNVAHSAYQGRVMPLHFAYCLVFMYGHMYITENNNTDRHIWYEFVSPSSKDRETGQLFKWRQLGTEPDSLICSMSESLQPVMNMVLAHMKAWINKAYSVWGKGDPRISYVEHLCNVYDRRVMDLLKPITKRDIVKEACTLFKNNSFLKKLDLIPDIIGVGNGVVEFNSSEKRLLNYYHTYPITKFTDTNYIEYDESNPYIITMYEVLRSLFPPEDTDALDFLLYFFATSLDGYEKEALFMIIYGGGSNGKSVLMELFKQTLGETYTRKLPLSFITEQGRTKASGPDPALMELKYARMVYYSESDRNEKVNAAKVKELTGGETMSGRALFKGQENFKANCNHIVTTNYRFIIESNDHATWRRFLCYRFKYRFAENDDPKDAYVKLKNPELIDKVKKDKRYHEAFLAILMHYHTMLYQKYNGRILKVPKPSIDKETKEYRIREDIFERFITQRIIVADGLKQPMDEFVENFRNTYTKQGGGDKLVMAKDDIIHNFRNSSIGKYIKEIGVGTYQIEDLQSLDANEYTNDDTPLLVKQRDHKGH